MTGYPVEYANNLNPNTAKGGGTAEERKENVKELLNFFPVIGEDEQGELVELDAEKVLTCLLYTSSQRNRERYQEIEKCGNSSQQYFWQ